MILLIINFYFLPKTLLTRDRNPLLFVSFSRLTCQKDKCYFRFKLCTITESTINHLKYFIHPRYISKKYKTRHYKNTSYYFMLTFFGREVAPQQKSRTNQDVRCSICKKKHIKYVSFKTELFHGYLVMFFMFLFYLLLISRTLIRFFAFLQSITQIYSFSIVSLQNICFFLK